jgi:hypothetical protein
MLIIPMQKSLMEQTLTSIIEQLYLMMIYFTERQPAFFLYQD